jgi:hypothetical protein
MDYNQFDKSEVKRLRAELSEVLNKFAEQRNLKIDLGNISFDNATVNCKSFTVSCNGASSPQQLRISSKVGFKGNAYGQTFKTQGQTFTITKLKPHNKRQIIAESNKGMYAFPKTMVEAAAPELFI